MPQPPSPVWEDRWGAVATDAPHGIFGSAANMRSKSSAEQTAMADCKAKGGINCIVENWYSNSCAVMVVGDGGYNVTARDTLVEATERGMRYCTDAKRTNCRVHFSTCSLPVQIR
ncbi:MAG: DUF4189 domain-containing protein [Methylobacillus sp.]|nr:DUF4189 domain-containing protein [Methylobacillus sp.]